MDKIIFAIKKQKEIQNLSDNALAKKAGLNQVRVSRLLNGTTKKLDLEVIEKLQKALGVAEEPQPYGVTSMHRALTPDEEKLLKMMEVVPGAKFILMGLMDLDEKTRTIEVGEMLKNLDKLKSEK